MYTYDMEKSCKICKKTKRIEDYYLNHKLSGGHWNACKKCVKARVNKRYYDPIARKKIIEYERIRGQKENRKLKDRIYKLERRLRNSGKYKARYKMRNAIRDGKLIPSPCEVCGELKVEGHHTDYRKPLFVKWLCHKHHLEAENKIPFN